MELAYTTRPYREFNETVAKIEEITATKGLRVLHIHDVRATLQEKGFEKGAFKIVEICNAGFAHQALSITEDVGLFMPCKINVYIKDGETIISAMRPAMISGFFAEPDLKKLADEADFTVRSIIDEAK
jgi:uncharacterized protein (DUF302 family)